MRQLNSLTVITLVICLWVISVIPAHAETGYNTKLLLHGTKPVVNQTTTIIDTTLAKDSSVAVDTSIVTVPRLSLAAWFIIPNPGAKVTVAVTGPKYSGNDWWIELNAGAFIKENKGEGMIDIRFSYDKEDPVHVWGNVEYFTGSKDWYTYLDANYRLGQVCLIGAETENMHFKGAVDDYGYGPRLVVPFNDNFVLIGAYQFHSGPNQIWARAVLNF